MANYHRDLPSAPAQKSPKVRVQNTNAKSRAQSSRAHFTSAKTRNSIFWKFLGNHMMEISWKLYAGKFFGNYMLVTSWWKLCVGKFGFGKESSIYKLNFKHSEQSWCCWTLQCHYKLKSDGLAINQFKLTFSCCPQMAKGLILCCTVVHYQRRRKSHFVSL